MCYLPKDKLNNKFALIMAEQVSSYIVIFPLSDLKAQRTAAMLREGIPQCSQTQGSVELGVKLVKLTLNKMVGMQSNQGRDYWTKLIPHVPQSIKSTHPYQTKLSRIHLVFSPLYHLNEVLLVSNPALLQTKCYDDLTRMRTTNLLKKSQTQGKDDFRLGQLCSSQTTTLEQLISAGS